VTSPEPSALSLRSRIRHVVGWTLFGSVGTQALRFLNNLILTYFLLPEAFGLMMIVTSIMVGLTLLTDIGISQGILVHQDGDDSRYMDTAWTLQIIKGLFIAILLVAFADLAARFYTQPELKPLLYIMALVSLLSGFSSTKPILARRNLLHADRQVWLGLGIQVLGMAATALLAFIEPSAVSLAWGNVFTTCLSLYASHCLYPGKSNRLALHQPSVRHLFSFGGMVMLTSGMIFLSGEGSRLLTACFLSPALIGLSGLASNLTFALTQLVYPVANRAFIPAFSELFRSGDQARLARAVERSRALLIAPVWVISVFFIFLGPWVVDLIYRDSYQSAGALTQLMGVSGMMMAINSSYNGILYAIGRPKLSFYALIFLSAVTLLSIWVGFQAYGIIGVLVSPIVVGILYYPAQLVVHRAVGLWSARLDLTFLALSAVVGAVAVRVIDWGALARL